MVLNKLYNDNQFEKVKMDKLVSHYAPIYPKNKGIIAAQYHRRQVVWYCQVHLPNLLHAKIGVKNIYDFILYKSRLNNNKIILNKNLPSNIVSYLLLHSLPIQHLLEEICLHQLVSE